MGEAQEHFQKVTTEHRSHIRQLKTAEEVLIDDGLVPKSFHAGGASAQGLALAEGDRRFVSANLLPEMSRV